MVAVYNTNVWSSAGAKERDQPEAIGGHQSRLRDPWTNQSVAHVTARSSRGAWAFLLPYHKLNRMWFPVLVTVISTNGLL